MALDSKSYRTTLIREVAHALKIKKGDRIVFIQDETGRIFIRKA